MTACFGRPSYFLYTEFILSILVSGGKGMADTMESRMEKTVASLKEEFNTIRTGRASASIFDRVRVDYYGTPTPLNQVGTISIPEARLVVVSPFDKSLISAIEKAIQKAELGLNPSNDGKVIRIAIPPLTADRRKELVKQAKTIAENYRTTIRNVRRDGNDDLKKQQKAGDLTEDQLKQETDKLQKLTDKYIEEINKAYDAKEKEIMD
jgi:ribosome recycling factor